MITYYARVDYSYSGDSKFTIPFPYIKKEHIVVLVNDVKTTNYTYITSSQIEVKDELQAEDVVSIRRTTPIKDKLVSFTDLNILNGETQNLAQEQVFNAVQEMYDKNEQQTQNFQKDINAYKEEIEDKIQEVKDATDVINTFKEGVETCVKKAEEASNSADVATAKAEELKDSVDVVSELESSITNKANRNLDNIDWNNLDQRAKDSLGATIKTYHNVVYGVAKTVAFGGDYSNFTAIDISSYANGTYYVYKVDVTNEETQEVTSSISITTTASDTALQIAKIKIASGAVSEVLTSLQYPTETPLQEVTVHTEASWNATNEVDDSELNLVPHTFVDEDIVNPVTVPANTDCSYDKDGVFEVGSSAIATIQVTKSGVTREFYGTSRKIKAGVHFKSSLSGKFYYFEGQ